jgi:tRNA (cytidine/uridine-2'-O-)-methyltransferase
MHMHLALYQPDIPQNAGTILRLCACMGVTAHIIEPAGFQWSHGTLRRSGLDYLDHVDIVRHISFERFMAARPGGRLVLVSTHAPRAYADFSFDADDILMMGRESAGVPDAVHDAADASVKVPMTAGMRSLNVAVAAAMVLGEALRQTGGFPPMAP